MSGTLEAYQASVKGILAAGGVDPTGLVLAMPFWANSFGDHSGQGYNGTAYGDAYIDGDGVLQLDGVGDYVKVSDLFSGLTALSISGWINLAGVTGDKTFVGAWYGGGSGSGQVLLYHDDPDGWRLILRDGDDNINAVTTPDGASSTDTWMHVVTTWGSTTGSKLYINGTLKETDATQIGPIRTDTSSIRFGQDTDGTRGLDGTIATPLIWNRALSPTEVTNLNNLGRI